MRTLALIPARGGSKGVPGKNLRDLAGKPLIAHTIEVAREVGDRFADIVVSTDDEEIARVSKREGAKVPFLRPPELATDTTPMAPVVRHALSFMERESGAPYDWVCLLQPTDPLRVAEDIHGALDLCSAVDTDSVISVVRVYAVHPVLMKRIEGGRLVPFCVPEPEGTPRQHYDPPAYMRNGAIYLTRRDVIMSNATLWGDSITPYEMPPERSVSIDDHLDLLMAGLLLKERSTLGDG